MWCSKFQVDESKIRTCSKKHVHMNIFLHKASGLVEDHSSTPHAALRHVHVNTYSSHSSRWSKDHNVGISLKKCSREPSSPPWREALQECPLLETGSTGELWSPSLSPGGLLSFSYSVVRALPWPVNFSQHLVMDLEAQPGSALPFWLPWGGWGPAHPTQRYTVKAGT